MTQDEKPAVAVACSSPSWGGMEMEAVFSAAALAERGYPVLFLARRGTPIEREARERDLAVFPILSGSHIAPLTILRAARLFRKNAVRLVHAEYSKDLWTVVPAARLAGGVPVILTKHIASSIDKKDPLHRFLFSRTARVVAISSAIRENLLKRTPIPPERIVTIPNGVDLERFKDWGSFRAEARAEFGIRPDAPLAGLVGRISRGKGHLEFLRAAAAVKKRVPGVRFLIVGSVTKGEEATAREAEALAREAGLEEDVRFTGFRGDIPRILSALDVLVVPSRSEAFGIVVVEGMAAGRPIVASGRAGILDIVSDGETGILFPPDDSEKLAEALVRVLEDPDLGRAMGERGRRRAEDLFDRRKRTDRVEALYGEILEERFRAAEGNRADASSRAPSRVWTNRHGLLRVPWRISLFLSIVFSLSIASFLLLAPLLRPLLGRDDALGVQGIPLSLAAAGYVLGIASVFFSGAFVARRFDRRPAASLGLGFHPRWIQDLAHGLLLGALLIGAVAGVSAAAGTLSLAPAGHPLSTVLRDTLRIFFLFALVAVFEELLFRGYLLQVLAEGIGKARAALLLSAAFGVTHAFNTGGTAAGALSTGCAGLLLSLAYFRTRSLWLPIGIHTTWNFALGWILAAPVSGEVLEGTPFIYQASGPEWMTGGAFGPEAGLPALAGMGLLALYLARSKRVRATEEALRAFPPPEERV
jgi:glycosyltransferase involved in cell wall biosynthesis/membrane protease YdiL (CAAX protease family)